MLSINGSLSQFREGSLYCFLEKSGFLVGQYIISSVSSLMVPQAACECLLRGSPLFLSRVSTCRCGSTRFTHLIFTTDISSESHSTPFTQVFGLHKVTTKDTEDGFSQILFSIYPINTNQNNSTSTEHCFQRQLKRTFSHPCLLGHGFLKATCQGMKAPLGSNKYRACYPNNPGGHCQVVGRRSIFLLYTVLWSLQNFPSSLSTISKQGENRSMTPYRSFNLLWDKIRTHFILYAAHTLLRI